MRQHNVKLSSFLALTISTHIMVAMLSACGTPAEIQEEQEQVASIGQGLSIKRTYDKEWAKKYALNTVYKRYGTDNPFRDYPPEWKEVSPGKWGYVGGNCTNFVSQALVGGFINSDNPSTVFSNRTDFAADKTSTGSLKWYWNSDADRGDAWTGAANLQYYAANNKETYKGAHFRFITQDTKTTYMDVSLVDIGDIIFADWKGDGSINHSMLVTRIDTGVKADKTAASYNRIRITAQTDNVDDKSLATINADHSYTAIFYVYRPVDYNPDGK